MMYILLIYTFITNKPIACGHKTPFDDGMPGYLKNLLFTVFVSTVELLALFMFILYFIYKTI
jgi:hypothetical protein